MLSQPEQIGPVFRDNIRFSHIKKKKDCVERSFEGEIEAGFGCDESY